MFGFLLKSSISAIMQIAKLSAFKIMIYDSTLNVTALLK